MAPLRSVGLFLLFVCTPLVAMERPPVAAVATAHPLATQAGLKILNEGGNAFDAAVAVSAALAVVEPQSSGLGGGGFWLIHRARDGFETMVDGRERAPAAARSTMYQDEKGEVVPGLSMDGPLAAAIPGEPAALVHIAQKYGRLPLKKSLAPAIRYARKGFEATALYRRLARFRLEVLRSSSSAHVFLQNGKVPNEGYRIRQPDLARTLEALARQGTKGFYHGPIAKRLVRKVREAGGIWTSADLADYRILEREPVRGTYRGLTITSASPPSSGGVALITMLNILQGYDLKGITPARRSHLIIEAMRHAYRDRAEYLGDPDQVTVPIARLTDPAYAARLRAAIRVERATPSASTVDRLEREGTDTTHFSILDRDGNYVAATLSINYPFGSGFMPEGTGVLLNDEMDDFSSKPGVPNAYGLVGSDANAIAPGKRMLSSMSPTFVTTPDRVAILGTPGGSRIITMVLLGILDIADGQSPEQWVAHRRFHHQYLPDKVFYEPGAFSASDAADLHRLGHRLEASDRVWGNMQAILWEKKSGYVRAASDPRGEGLSVPGGKSTKKDKD